MSVVAATQKQLAVLQGEVDGLACKLNGYERALQDCEFELAERDLQVVLLKSFIKNLDNSTNLQLNFQEVLEHNGHLLQQLQELSNATHHASAPATPAGPATTAMQVSLLRTALAEANYRLAAAGLLPVAATRLQEVATGSQDTTGFGSSLTASTPLIIKRSFSRLFRNQYSSRPPSSTNSTITPSSSTSSRSSPCAPARCLACKMSEGAAAEGPDTPSGLDGRPPALRHVDSHSEALMPCETPPPGQAAAASTTAPAATASLDQHAGFPAAVQPEAHAAGTASTASACAQRSNTGFQDLEPYTYTAGEFSDAGQDDTDSSSSNHAAQASCTPASPSICLLGSPSKALTPPCSPCSSISCDSLSGGGMRHSYAVDVCLARGLAGWPGVTCSCDNPLFAADADETDQ